MSVSDKELNLLESLGKTYLSGGGYYVIPVNTFTKKQETYIILDKSSVKKGFNNLVYHQCLH